VNSSDRKHDREQLARERQARKLARRQHKTTTPAAVSHETASDPAQESAAPVRQQTAPPAPPQPVRLLQPPPQTETGRLVWHRLGRR
jgi:hypothetical protein